MGDATARGTPRFGKKNCDVTAFIEDFSRGRPNREVSQLNKPMIRHDQTVSDRGRSARFPLFFDTRAKHAHARARVYRGTARLQEHDGRERAPVDSRSLAVAHGAAPGRNFNQETASAVPSTTYRADPLKSAGLPMRVETSSAVAQQRHKNKEGHAHVSQIMEGSGRENFDIECRTTSKRARAA